MRLYGIVLLLCILLMSCESESEIIVKPPEPKAWTVEDIDAVVGMELKSIYSPAPTENGMAPAACDEIRYYSLQPKTPFDTPDAILMLATGMDTGMGAGIHLGKNLIYVAKTYQDKNIKVLITERRGNCLEDLTGLNAAEDAKDMDVAIDYYYKAKPIDGQVFKGFITSDEAPYLSEFGYKLNIEDFYKIITTEVPDPAVRRQKLYIAGHSMSGMTLAVFAAWDFDGDPLTLDDAGYRNCAGFISLDTFITVDPEINQATYAFIPETMRTLVRNMLTKYGYNGAVNNLRSGQMNRIFCSKLLPETFMLTEMAAMQADWAPDQESTFFEKVPYSDDAEKVMNMIFAGTYRELKDEKSSYKNIRCTNLALSGLLFDDNFHPMSGWTLAMGFLGGGKVADKNFPFPDMLGEYPAFVDQTQVIVSPYLFYPTEKGSKIYHWINFDEIMSSPYAPPEDEVVDINDYIKAVYSGSSNYYEWYFPTRHLVDQMAVNEKGWIGDKDHYLHTDFERKTPILKLASEYGIVTTYVDVTQSDYIVLDGYTHFDILMASANRPESHPNKVIDAMLEFILHENDR